jgi:hypothetical protein
MKRADLQDDSTVKLSRPHASRSSQARSPSQTMRWAWLVAAVFVVLAGGATAGWVFWPRHAPLVAKTAVPQVIPQAPRPPEFDVVTATEARIRDNVPTDLTIFRLAANPDVLILDFASLHEQGVMLNRLGAFAEKAQIPHDRVLTDVELDQAIRRGGDTPETFYYGHDYSASTVARFFALADRDQVALTPLEELLRRLMQQEGWLSGTKSGGLISVPRAGLDARVTPDVRAAILHHELSHGEYFSNPAYAAYTHLFWTTVLTELERQAVRRYLVAENYDPSLDDLMENEAQAYLIFTDNPVFFTPSMVGMTEVRRAELRAIFLRNVPAPWMRDAVPPQPAIAKAAAH